MLLVGPGIVVTRNANNEMLRDGGVLIVADQIKEIGDFIDLKQRYAEAEIVDAKGGVIHPGLINAHHHIYSAFSRGLALSGYDPKGFLDILEGLWWRLDSALNVEDSKWSAEAAYLACIKAGVTTIFDHHASYGETRGSLSAMAEVGMRHGVRSCLCYEISDRNGAKAMQEALWENLEFAQAARSKPEELAGLIGLHASFTLSEASMRQITAANSSNVGYHVHLAEGKLDQEDCLAKYGERVTSRLLRHGILNPNSLAGHCIHVDEVEKDLIAQSGVNVCHNPESNMGNAVGAPDVLGLMKRGVLVGLGTDGYTSDMLESLKFANLLVKHREQDATVGWIEAPQMLFANNATLATKFFGIKLGVLEAGAAADIAIFDYDEITPLLPQNIDSHFIFGMSGGNVHTTISKGKVRMQNRVLLGQDEEALISKIKAQAQSFATRI